MVFAKGNSLVGCVNGALAPPEGERRARADPAAVASEGDRRAGLEVEGRSSRVLGSWGAGEGRRGVLIALVSTVVFLTVMGLVITNAPGWPEVKATFFDWGQFKARSPRS